MIEPCFRSFVAGSRPPRLPAGSGFGRRRAAAIRALILAGLAMTVAGPGGAAAEEEGALYRARAIVTGQVEPERSRGFALCLAEIVVKLSGDPTLLHDVRLPPLQAHAADLVESFSYHDRMAGIPVHDEQGTRERPYDLTVNFDRAKIDALLRGLDRMAWTAPRPRLALFIGFAIGGNGRVLTSDSDDDFVQRLALDDASEVRGMPIVLPSRALLAARAISYDLVAGAMPAPLDEAAHALGGDLALIGLLSWTDASLSWQVEWQLAWQGTPHRWRTQAENFDAAFRTGIEGAEQILSGHGEP
jgi:hypothetical protein